MRRHLMIATGVLCAAAGATLAEIHPAGVPVLNSRPGAAYTIYLDFAGFSFSGTWLNGGVPGVTPAYDNASGVFTSAQQANIANIWARVAEKYAPFNINVTTVDPALTAGKAGTDAARQAYYDQTQRLMHTIIGGGGGWYSSSGSTGTSGIRTTQSAYSTMDNGGAGAGFHTNFVFAGLMTSNVQYIGEIAAHENGHGLGAMHHVDVAGSTLVNAYGSNFGATGYGSYAPVMGNSMSSQRGTWRVGTSDRSGWAIQNDVRTIQTNSGIGGFVDDGIGHSITAATPLPLAGSLVDPAAAKGIIVPASSTNPNPIGVASYVTDYFWFRSDGAGTITLAAVDGGSRLTPGVADPGATLRSTLRILDTSMNVVGTATMAASTLSETFVGTLPAGRYFAEVASAGGYTSTSDPTAQYFDMGSYFLTGSGFSAAKWMATSGDWATAGNWLGQMVPQPTEDVSIQAGAAVTHVTGNDTVRGLTNAGNLTVSGGTLTVQTFTQTSGSTVINGGGLVLNDGLTSGGSSSKTAGPPTGAVVVNVGGTLTVNYVRQGTLTSAGRASVRPARDGGDTSYVGALTLLGAGTLDVADNRLIVATGGLDPIWAYLRSAYNGGAWNGPGLTSSAAQADSADRMGIGYALASQLGVSAWGSVAGLTGSEVLTRLTYFGDANLDGFIDADDYALTDRGYGRRLAGWVFGDFDYSGTVDIADYWLLDRGFLLQGGTSRDEMAAMLAGREAEFGGGYVATLMASLPEPGLAVGMIGVVVAWGGGRRRGKK